MLLLQGLSRQLQGGQDDEHHRSQPTAQEVLWRAPDICMHTCGLKEHRFTFAAGAEQTVKRGTG